MTVEVKQAQIDVAGTQIDGWVARYDGSEAKGHSREGALKNLVVAVAQESL